MTIDEKISLLVGIGTPGEFGNPPSRVRGAAGETREIKRLGIPPTVHADGPAGLRIEKNATAFPVAVMIASTWNREMARKVGEAMGEEAKEYGVDFLLAPGMNIHRNPLCGRNFEYYSEDPFLTGEMAASFVEGVQSQGVGACLKHFAGNEQETKRYTIDTIISERALREIYLKGFEIAIKKAKPWTVMSAYNKLNGYHASQNEWLLTEVLKEEWKFEGFVMSDWYAGDSASCQIKAGNDLIMPGESQQRYPERKRDIEEIKEALEKGLITEEIINERVRRILKVLTNTISFKKHPYSDKPDLEKNAKISYEAASEGVVLLKNDKVLPLYKGAKLAIFGTGQIETFKGGLGSGNTNPKYVVSILEGFRKRGLSVDEELAATYEEKVKKMRQDEYKPTKAFGNWLLPKLPEDWFDEIELERIAERNEVGIIVITRSSSEGIDRALGEGYPIPTSEWVKDEEALSRVIPYSYYYLTQDEKNLIIKVSRAFHLKGKKVCVMLNIGGVIEVASWRDFVDGILLLWQPGQEAGYVAADICSGEINPSGKLPTTFPMDYKDVPSWTYPGEPKENPERVVYEEDIYVGYRHYDTFGKEVAYEFGFGLSYTEFEYKGLRIEKRDEALQVEFEIKNVGNCPGKEVAQVYIKAPKGKIDKPYQELKGFEKTHLLNPGESQEIKIEIPLKSLASFDGKDWLLEGGKYLVRIGSSSRDIRLIGSIEIEEEKRYSVFD
ncbi:beta-glucosidase family protein [Caldanaerobacter sp.]|uniref:beta-glucosidase n=1 Tax=Caldanaerobacter sp. TaxID=2930036 RepID=UPI003C7874C5